MVIAPPTAAVRARAAAQIGQTQELDNLHYGLVASPCQRRSALVGLQQWRTFDEQRRRGRFASIPAMLDETVERFGERPSRSCDGELTLTYAELVGEAATDVRRRPGGLGGRARRPRCRSGRRNCAEWVVAVLGLCRAPAPSSSRSTPASRASRRPTSCPQPGPGPGDRDRLPRAPTTWPCSRAPGSSSPTSRPIVAATGPAIGSGGGLGGLPGAGHDRAARAEVERRSAGARARRPVRHPLHLGDDRRPQGRGHDPRPHADRGHATGWP